jgi:mannose-6-phosphate isomerase-like protein (cupin superfamily)
MLSSREFIESGILEQYVYGMATEEERTEVEKRQATDPEIRQEIEAISLSMEQYAKAHAIEPNPIIKPFLMASLDYTVRLQHGEPPADPPELHEGSKISDYETWLNREDMINTGKADVFAKIIGYTPKAITAIVWLKDYAPQEVHDAEHERFLIVEGTCDIFVEDEVNHLRAGDYFAIPLHKNHMVKVTSQIPCKVILQRVAA